ncbi:DNA repair protein RecN [Segnochrobactraceae bacterium EtOH-i3]
MLVRLSIRDIVLIDRLDIDFPEGLTVLTGETGAGKSILLDSLSLALGGRGDAGLVRHGAPQGQVTAVFDLPAAHPARAIAAENGIDTDGDLILRRVQSADGRTRAFLNDQPVSTALVKSVAGLLVEIHGQNDARALVDPATHRGLIDAFGDLGSDVAAVEAAWRARRKAETELAALVARMDKARADQDYLRAMVDELDALAPEAGEEDVLAEARARMMRVERIATDLSEATDELSGPASPIPAMAGLMRSLARKRDEAPELLDPTLDALGRALDALEEARSGLDRALAATEFDPRVLEQTEERLFALRAAARKHQVPADRLPEVLEKYRGALQEIDAGEHRLTALEAEVTATRAAFEAAATALTAARTATARTLEQAVMAELPALKLERARFLVEIRSDADNAGPSGVDQVEFWVQTNPGTRAGPMMKVASGGELSRFLLALKVALADRGSAPTLVFDEIDTGVGGAVAEAIGVRLARLSAQVQVLAVTHAPQVAARAAGHLLIAKEPTPEGDRVATRVTPIEADRRREEIARMLAGAVVTDEARAAADRLIGHGAA